MSLHLPPTSTILPIAILLLHSQSDRSVPNEGDQQFSKFPSSIHPNTTMTTASYRTVYAFAREMHPKTVKTDIKYGTAGFRTRWAANRGWDESWKSVLQGDRFGVCHVPYGAAGGVEGAVQARWERPVVCGGYLRFLWLKVSSGWWSRPRTIRNGIMGWSWSIRMVRWWSRVGRRGPRNLRT